MYPYIVYCNVIWGNAPNSHLWQIFKLQKRAIRIITNTKYRNSTKRAFHKLKILRLPEIYMLSALIFVFKFKNGLLPPVFGKQFLKNREYHNYMTRNAHQLRTPQAKTQLASTFIKKTGVDLWNGLQPQTKLLKKIWQFKKEIIPLLLAPYIL